MIKAHAFAVLGMCSSMIVGYLAAAYPTNGRLPVTIMAAIAGTSVLAGVLTAHQAGLRDWEEG